MGDKKTTILIISGCMIGVGILLFLLISVLNEDKDLGNAPRRTTTTTTEKIIEDPNAPAEYTLKDGYRNYKTEVIDDSFYYNEDENATEFYKFIVNNEYYSYKYDGTKPEQFKIGDKDLIDQYADASSLYILKGSNYLIVEPIYNTECNKGYIDFKAYDLKGEIITTPVIDKGIALGKYAPESLRLDSETDTLMVIYRLKYAISECEPNLLDTISSIGHAKSLPSFDKIEAITFDYSSEEHCSYLDNYKEEIDVIRYETTYNKGTFSPFIEKESKTIGDNSLFKEAKRKCSANSGTVNPV